MIELDERLLTYERVRRVAAEWSEMLIAIARAVRQLEAIGEGAQVQALRLDYQHLHRRAQLHIRQVATQEASRGVLASTRMQPIAAEDG